MANAAALAEKTQNKTSVDPAQPRAETAGAARQVADKLGDRVGAARQTLMRMQNTHGNQAVMRMLGNSQEGEGQVYRKCSCAGGGSQCAECAASEEQPLNRQASGGSQPGGIPEVVNDVLRSQGQPLDSETRSFMEPRFGSDLSGVRIHTGNQAAASAKAVDALAYSVGSHIVFGDGQYAPGTEPGRSLIAHELAHVVQQRGAAEQPPQRISNPQDASEREADRAAQAVLRKAAPPDPSTTLEQPGVIFRQTQANAGVLHRKIAVTPSSQTQFIADELNTLCFGKIDIQGDTISQSCVATTNNSCDCACDTVRDPDRTYTVIVRPASGSTTAQTLWDGSTQAVPSSTLWPNTEIDDNPTISVESADSNLEFGAFKADGSPFWYPHWRILAHELCGHGRLRQSYEGSTGDRPQHDSTIDTENALAAEHGGEARGHYKDRRQGEAFYNPVGDRSKVVFKQKDGLHYEAP